MANIAWAVLLDLEVSYEAASPSGETVNQAIAEKKMGNEAYFWKYRVCLICIFLLKVSTYSSAETWEK